MFITFEGIEGCGKTTQVRRLVDRLTDLGVAVTQTLEPGDTRIGQDIRSILLDTKNRGISPLTEVLLYAADRAQHFVEVIRPALSQGRWVVCDRFFDATTVYQGYARGQDIPLINALNEKACMGVRPDLTILVDCPVEIGLDRARRRIMDTALNGLEDRFEQQDLSFHQKVREGYLELAAQFPERFRVLDATMGPEQLHEEIVILLEPYFNSS